jgi:hypothetical protein
MYVTDPLSGFVVLFGICLLQALVKEHNLGKDNLGKEQIEDVIQLIQLLSAMSNPKKKSTAGYGFYTEAKQYIEGRIYWTMNSKCV